MAGRWRVLYVLAAAGFASQAVAAELGTAPRWPNPHVWTLVALCASVILAAYALTNRRAQLRLATAMIVMAAAGRVGGWAVSGRPAPSIIAAAGVWTIVASLILVVYIKAGET